jgi:hypothetical protein
VLDFFSESRTPYTQFKRNTLQLFGKALARLLRWAKDAKIACKRINTLAETVDPPRQGGVPCGSAGLTSRLPARHGFMPAGHTTQHMENFAEIAGLEPVVIDGETELPDFKQQLRYNEIYYHLATRLGRL